MVASNNTNEIRLIRTYNAPLQVVWDAWNDPVQAAKWWGPRGFTITTHGKDLRPGGFWSYTMHGPDGTDYENKTLYHEVEVGKKLVYDHGGSDDRPPLFRVTVLFSEQDGRTTLDMCFRVATVEEANNLRKMIKAASGNSTWDRLAEYLDATQHSKCIFVINRSFASTPEAVFDKWIDATQLAQWLPPQGCEMSIQPGIVHVGETRSFQMISPDGTMHGELEYRKLVRPECIVYQQRFCDEHGQPSRHPGQPLFPESLLISVSFTLETLESTRVTLIAEPLSDVTAEEQQAFEQTRTNMTHGWNNSFDQLEELITQER